MIIVDIVIIIIINVAPGLVTSAIGVECWSFVAAVVQGTVTLFDDDHHHDGDDDIDDFSKHNFYAFSRESLNLLKILLPP